jgi:hypothetical protein
MCTVLGLETTGYDIARLTDYKNHYVLTNNEKVKLFALCRYLSPDVLNNKCIIHSDELCGDSPNRFIRFNSKETAFVAAEYDVVKDGCLLAVYKCSLDIIIFQL